MRAGRVLALRAGLRQRGHGSNWLLARRGSGEFMASTLPNDGLHNCYNGRRKRPTGPYWDRSWRIVETTRNGYLSCLLMAAFSAVTTSAGSGAYDSCDTIPCPLSSIQNRKSLMILPLAASLGCTGISSQVKLAIG